MIPQSRKIFGLTVHYGDPVQTRALVESLLRGLVTPEHVVVVDHDPSPFEYESDRVTVVRPETNAGYGAGIQTGLGVLISRRIDPMSIVVCINNDAQVSPTVLKHVSEFFDTQEVEGLVGARMGVVNLITGRADVLQGQARQRMAFLPYIDGAFFAAPLRTLLQLQVPTDYFLYWEDVLLSLRAHQQHISLLHLPLKGFRHQELGTSSPDKMYYLVRNGALVLETETPQPWRMYWWLLNRIRYLYHSWTQHTDIAHALRDAIQHKKGKKL